MATFVCNFIQNVVTLSFFKNLFFRNKAIPSGFIFVTLHFFYFSLRIPEPRHISDLPLHTRTVPLHSFRVFSFPLHLCSPLFSRTVSLSPCLPFPSCTVSPPLADAHLDPSSLSPSPTVELCFSVLIGPVFLLFHAPINGFFFFF